MPVERPDDEGRALHAHDQHPRSSGELHLAVSHRTPALPGEIDVPDRVQAADLIERDHLSADEPAVHAPSTMPSVASRQADAHPGPHENDAHRSHHHRGNHLYGDGTGGHNRHNRAGEAANGREQGVKREVVELNGEQYDACSDPCDGQASTFFLTPNCTTQTISSFAGHGHTMALRRRPADTTPGVTTRDLESYGSLRRSRDGRGKSVSITEKCRMIGRVARDAGRRDRV